MIEVKREVDKDGSEWWRAYRYEFVFTFYTQKEAVHFAKNKAIEDQDSLTVYRADGSVQSKDNFPVHEYGWSTMR